MTARARATVGVLVVAAALRVGLFAFAENKHGDAPMRALIAERLVLDPASAGQPRTYCQFGPLHTTLMRPFIALDRNAARSSRYLSLLAGLLVFFPFLSLARRLAGDTGAAFAAFVLAVSPLHVQASTTAASEALYLLLWVAAIDRLLAALETGRLGTFVAAGLLGSLAALTRYDAWLALPMVAGAVWFFRRRAGAPVPARGLVAYAAAAASLPAGWLAWGAAVGGDPLFFAHYISADHAGLAATAAARYGPLLGRARQIGIWALAFVAAMTPLGVGLVFAAARRRPRRLSPAMAVTLVAALGPPALYLARGLATQSFEPLARFGLVPGALLLPFAATALPPARLAAARWAAFLGALGFSVAVWLVATAGSGRIWAGAESMGALTRLDDEDRALAAYLRATRPPGARVMIEPFSFAEIGIAHAAGLPWQEAVTLTITRTPRATVRDSLLSTGAQLIVGYDRPGGWPRTLPDWPRAGRKTGQTFGHWIVVGRNDLPGL
ncbi:MAG TPA: glycosyltransferase family 39 protein [Polyangia bacterium]|nr:glycosyltransferase family 39 protein [Polyangia bacterium]